MSVFVIVAALAVPFAGAQMPAALSAGPPGACSVPTDSSDTTFSYVLSAVPTIDGYLELGEWDDACRTYIGDSAAAYFKQDSQYWYVAFALQPALTRNINDQVGLYIDEDNDGEWNPDRSEGNYWIWVNGANLDEVQFRWIANDTFGQGLPVAGAAFVSGTFNGFLCFEARLPIGRLPYQITLNDFDNDTIGLFAYALAGARWIGWWPPGMPDTLWDNPAYYGKCIFRLNPSGVGGSVSSMPHARATIAPSVVTGGFATVTCEVPRVRTVRVSLFDALGRCVAVQSLPGSGLLDLRGHNAGAYVVKLETAGGMLYRKLIIQR